MECRYCHYCKPTTMWLKNNEKCMVGMCSITHSVGKKSCDYIASDAEVEDMNICYNCKHWIGGGDWGLSCRKNYYIASTDGFNEVCEQFERK